MFVGLVLVGAEGVLVNLAPLWISLGQERHDVEYQVDGGFGPVGLLAAVDDVLGQRVLDALYKSSVELVVEPGWQARLLLRSLLLHPKFNNDLLIA